MVTGCLHGAAGENGVVLDVSDEVGQNRVLGGFGSLLPRGWIRASCGFGRPDFQGDDLTATASLFIVFTIDMTAKNQTGRVCWRDDGFKARTVPRPLLGMTTPRRTKRLIAGVVAGTTPTPFHHPANTGSLPAVVPVTVPARPR